MKTKKIEIMKKLFLILLCIGCSIQYGMAQLDSLFVTKVKDKGNNHFLVIVEPKFEQDPAKGKMKPHFGGDGFDRVYDREFSTEIFQGLLSPERKEEFQEVIESDDIRVFYMDVSLDSKGKACYCSFFYSSNGRMVDPEELLTSEEWYKLYTIGRTMIYDLTKHKVEYINDGDGSEPDYTTKEYEYARMGFDLRYYLKK